MSRALLALTCTRREDGAGVRLYAHRGSPSTPSLENSVVAVATCLAGDADGVEIDLRLSVDGVLVVSHDPDLRRLTGLPLQVATSSWEHLQQAAARRGVALARAEWLLAAAAGRPVVLELKPPPPGLTGPTADAVSALLTGLRGAGLPLDVTVSSFTPSLVGAVRGLARSQSGVVTALLGMPGQGPGGLLRQALSGGHDEVHPHVGALLAEPSAVERAHGYGVRVVPWTANRGRDLRRLAGLGVDGVITDVPAAARVAVAAAALVALSAP